MLPRPSSPCLIGREAELAVLDAGLARAGGGVPTALFLVGEAGVGKTRLLREFIRQAGVRADHVLVGQCVPGLNPYAPVVDILRAAPPAARPGGRDDLDGAAPTPHEALMQLLDRLRDELTVVVVEDLHWADRSTAVSLNALIRGRRTGRVLVVCTIREDEPTWDQPLRQVIAELGRHVIRVPVPRLDRRETAAQVAGILGADADPAAIDRIFSRSGGNPFLVEELVASDPDGHALPDGLRDILLVRLRGLPDAVRRVVQVVAIAGGTAEHRLLAAVTNLPAAQLQAATRAAVERHILLTEATRYRFRHALVSEAVAADALPGERIDLHRAIAQALADRLPRMGSAAADAPVLAAEQAEVARHWSAAGEIDRALVSAIDAGLAAERAYAHAEARMHFEHALSLWTRAVPAHDRAALDLVGIYLHTAHCAYHGGDFDGAVSLLRRAIAETDEPDRLGVLHRELGGYLAGSAGGESAALAAYETADALLPRAPSADRARLHSGLAAVLMFAGRQDDARRHATLAARVAGETGAGLARAEALTTLGLDLVWRGEVRAGLARLHDAVAIADGQPSTYAHFYSRLRLTDGLQAAGRFAEAAAVALRGAEEVGRRGTERTYGDLLTGLALESWFWLGQWDDIDARLSHGSAEDTDPMCTLVFGLVRGSLHTARGDAEQAERALESCWQATSHGGYAESAGHASAAWAELHLWQDAPAEAYEIVSSQLLRLRASAHDPLRARLLAVATRAAADLTEVGGPDHLSDLEPLVRDLARRTQAPLTAAHLALAEAELARAAELAPTADERGLPRAIDAWARAAARWRRLGGPYPEAYARWRHAEATLRAAPGRDRSATGSATRSRALRRSAARSLASAHDIAAHLGASPLLWQTQRLARRARITMADQAAGSAEAARIATSGATTDPSTFGLTRREEDVLRLVGDGRTNREIAQALYISPKTVSAHVSNILAKLGVPNRSAAATLALRRGVLTRQPVR